MTRQFCLMVPTLKGQKMTNKVQVRVGKLASKRRKRFADRVQAHVLDDIEVAVARRMQGLPLESPAT